MFSCVPLAYWDNTTDLPPTNQVLRHPAPPCSTGRLAGTNGQLVDSADVSLRASVILCDGPSCALLNLFYWEPFECGKANCLVRHGSFDMYKRRGGSSHL